MKLRVLNVAIVSEQDRAYDTFIEFKQFTWRLLAVMYSLYFLTIHVHLFLCRIQRELADITLDPPPNCRYESFLSTYAYSLYRKQVRHFKSFHILIPGTMRADRVDVRIPRVDNFSNKRNIYMNATMINCNRPDQLIEEARILR